MKSELPKDILFTYFAGNATALQKKLIEEWLSGPESLELYFEYLEEWEINRPQFLPDNEIAFEKFSQRIVDTDIEENDTEFYLSDIKTKKKNLNLNVWKWAAAAVVALGTGIFSKDLILFENYKTANGELKAIILNDSSRVTLNANSSLKVPRFDFVNASREVFLDGEAEFNVTHTVDNKQFIVHTTDDSEILVLGTEFVVYTRKKGTRVVLNKGKVQLSSAQESKPLTMKPGDQVTIYQNGKMELEKLTKTEVELQSVWKEHRMVFDHTKLGEVATKLNEIYGVDVEIKDKQTAERELTGSFKAENVDEILDVLSEMLDIDISHRENKVYFNPKPVDLF
ncbi:FecR family protein [Dyadobacter frigoris]|uniref:DUF4974 domain-containing protein n=1 Tax=Dyadobacter frigoris TaxID=2576211 RepID=A0A4U6D964_9BACT|nr:FecR domain-containing protein [Dyadobacter frigoris]TKT92921.1 DUF4974 domain-containing protein [Dyadobacter frigoris]